MLADTLLGVMAASRAVQDMYEEQSFLRDPNLLLYITQILESLNEASAKPSHPASLRKQGNDTIVSRIYRCSVRDFKSIHRRDAFASNITLPAVGLVTSCFLLQYLSSIHTKLVFHCQKNNHLLFIIIFKGIQHAGLLAVVKFKVDDT
ncbi:hypothetical protein J6590_012715 [Homalodisca vitripennis]|nr:hypothetical protein J6590_012715 [Homalodisca vitripennis]